VGEGGRGVRHHFVHLAHNYFLGFRFCPLSVVIIIHFYFFRAVHCDPVTLACHFNLLSPNIDNHILLTVLVIFLMLLVGRI